MFTRLSKSSVQFQEWVVLGSVDLDDLVDHHCSVMSDWEKNFRALKARGRDAEKLPKLVKTSTVNVDIFKCINFQFTN